MRPAPWPRLVALAACVSGLHWWAIEPHDALRTTAMTTQVGPVTVMSAVTEPPPAEPAAAAPAVATPGKPLPTAKARPASAPRVAGAPKPLSPRVHQAFESVPRAAVTLRPVALPADETRDRADPAPPVEAPAAEPADAPPLSLLAQASPTMKPADAAAGASPPADPPVPTYRTKPPAAATLVYRLARGGIVGTGRIDWRPAPGGAYSLQLEGSLPLIGTLITQISRGRLDAAGLAPERHTDRRLRRGEQAANFDRAAGRISFSGQAPELALTAGVQDRVSVMIQLPAIVNAWARVPPVGEHLLIRVVGARGDAHVWSLRFEGPQGIDTLDGRVNALRFLREPEGANDTRAEFWLDPARQHLPAKVVLTDGKGEALELLRTP